MNISIDFKVTFIRSLITRYQFQCSSPHIYSYGCRCWTNRRLSIFSPQPAHKFLWHWLGFCSKRRPMRPCSQYFPTFFIGIFLFLRCAACPSRKPPRVAALAVTLAHSYQRCVYVMSKLSMANLHHVVNTHFSHSVVAVALVVASAKGLFVDRCHWHTLIWGVSDAAI